ncbi:MAG: Si-specific NAD(P)(+) transhydrogenase, partial [Verrucomicrobiota bacterium]
TLPMGIYTIPEMASVGLSEADAIKKNGSTVVGRAKFSEVARGQIAAIQDGMLKLICDPQGKKLLGIHIIGEGSTDLIHVGQMALYAGCDVDVFVDNIFNFPTMTEAYRVAAFDVIETRSKLPAA